MTPERVVDLRPRGALAAIPVAGAIQVIVRDQLAVRRGPAVEPEPSVSGGRPFT